MAEPRGRGRRTEVEVMSLAPGRAARYHSPEDALNNAAGGGWIEARNGRRSGNDMMFRIDGEFTTLRPTAFYGGRNASSAYEYLYRLPDGRWFLHTVNVATLAEPTFTEIPEEEAI